VFLKGHLSGLRLAFRIAWTCSQNGEERKDVYLTFVTPHRNCQTLHPVSRCEKRRGTGRVGLINGWNRPTKGFLAISAASAIRFRY
jgi:hypothetical protein